MVIAHFVKIHLHAKIGPGYFRAKGFGHARHFSWYDDEESPALILKLWHGRGQKGQDLVQLGVDGAGAAGYAYRLEGIRIQLVAKGGAAPGSTEKHFQQK